MPSAPAWASRICLTSQLNSPRKTSSAVVGMARSQDLNSENLQFFIMFDTAFSLDGQYIIVGDGESSIDLLTSSRRLKRPTMGRQRS